MLNVMYGFCMYELWHRTIWQIDTNVSEESTASVFWVELFSLSLFKDTIETAYDAVSERMIMN
jgi:hypothetical protein